MDEIRHARIHHYEVEHVSRYDGWAVHVDCVGGDRLTVPSGFVQTIGHPLQAGARLSTLEYDGAILATLVDGSVVLNQTMIADAQLAAFMPFLPSGQVLPLLQRDLERIY
jgi:hypothetical protein